MFVLELVGNPEDSFSHNAAQIMTVINRPFVSFKSHSGFHRVHNLRCTVEKIDSRVKQYKTLYKPK